MRHCPVCGLITALTALTALGASADTTHDLDVAWKPHFGRGVWYQDDLLTLVRRYPIASEMSVLAVEAETLSAWQVHENGGVRQDETGSGGAYLSSPKRLQLFVDLPVGEASFVPWYRVRLNAPLTESKHLQGVDASLGAAVGWVELEAPPGEWTWVKGPRRESFRAGVHELQMDAFPAGLDVDVLVLARAEDWTPPEDLGALPVSRVPVLASGRAETADFTFPQVTRWTSVAPATLDLADGTVRLSASLDRGKTWLPVPEDGDLGGLPTRADGTDRIRFRVDLSRHGPRSPRVGDLMLRLAAPDQLTEAVEDKQARWLFAKTNGALCGVVNRATGTELVPLNRPVPLFSLRLKPPGFCPDEAWQDVTALDAECLAAGVEEPAPRGFYAQRRFVYRVTRDDGVLDVTVRAAFRTGGESHWTLELTNGLRSLEVAEIAWPILNNVKTTQNPEADTVLLLGNYLFKAPCRVGRFFYPWPGSLLLPMLDLSGEREGMTLVARDDRLRTTMVSCAGQRREGVRLSLHKVMSLKPGESFRSRPNVVRVHDGDWRTACLLERPAAQRLYPQPADILPSIREMDGFEMEGWPVPRWDTFGAFGRFKRAQHGFPLLGLWNFQVPKVYWTVPHPNPMMGNAEDLRWAVRAFRRSGMRIGFYIQSLLFGKPFEGTDPDDRVGYLRRRRLWPGWELPAQGWAEANRSRKSNGEGHTYGNHPLKVETPMAHGSQAFHDYKWTWAVERFGRQIGLDGIYWDSNSHASPSWETNDRFGKDPGMSGRALLETQRAINKAYSELRPGGYVTVGEGSPCAAMNAVRHVHLANTYSLYPNRLLFPQMILVPGGANGQDLDMHRTFLAGARFYGVKYYQEHKPLQQSMIWMRKRVKQYLYPADYRDTLGLTVSDPAVEARILICAPSRTRGAVLNIRNPKRLDRAYIDVDASAFAPVKHAWLVDSERNDRAWASPPALEDGHTYRVPVPVAEASHVLLFERAEPRVTASVEGDLAAGSSVRVNLRVESLTGDRVRGRITLVPPGGLSTSPVSFETDAVWQGVAELRASVDAVSDIFDIPLRVEVDGGPAFERVITLFVHEPVTWQLDWSAPGTARLRLCNRTASEATVKVNVAHGEGTVRLARPVRGVEVGLAPGEQRDLNLRLVGDARAQTPWRLKGYLDCEFGSRQKRIEIHRQVWPVIPNGSLEICRFRRNAPEREYYDYADTPDKMVAFMRNIPDYWWGMKSDRSPQLTHHKGLTLDQTVPAAEGVRSLRLDSGKTCRANIALWLEPGVRYLFSASMRSAKPSPECMTQLYFHPAGGAGSPLRMTAEMAPGVWHRVETTFVAPAREAALYMYSDPKAAVWFDDFRALPLGPAEDAGE